MENIVQFNMQLQLVLFFYTRVKLAICKQAKHDATRSGNIFHHREPRPIFSPMSFDSSGRRSWPPVGCPWRQMAGAGGYAANGCPNWAPIVRPHVRPTGTMQRGATQGIQGLSRASSIQCHSLGHVIEGVYSKAHRFGVYRGIQLVYSMPAPKGMQGVSSPYT